MSKGPRGQRSPCGTSSGVVPHQLEAPHIFLPLNGYTVTKAGLAGYPLLKLSAPQEGTDKRSRFRATSSTQPTFPPLCVPLEPPSTSMQDSTPYNGVTQSSLSAWWYLSLKCPIISPPDSPHSVIRCASNKAVAPFSYSCSTRHALYRGNASDSWGTFHLSTGSILGLQCCSAAWELSLLSKEERNPSHELCCVVDGFLPFSQRRARVSPRSRSRLGISQPGWCHKPCNRAPKFQLHLDAYSTKDSAAWPRRGRFTEEWWGLCSSAEQTLAQSEMPCPLSRFTALPRGEAADPGGCPAAWASEERAHPTARPRKASLSSLHSQTLTRRRAGHQKRSRPGGAPPGLLAAGHRARPAPTDVQPPFAPGSDPAVPQTPGLSLRPARLHPPQTWHPIPTRPGGAHLLPAPGPHQKKVLVPSS
jgi:hypothetical protein